MNPFSAIITPQSVSFTTPEGKVHNIDSSHKRWDDIIAAIKKLQTALKFEKDNQLGFFPPSEVGSSKDCYAALAALVDEGAKIAAAGVGRVTVEGGIVYYDGEVVRNPITTRIVWGLSEGFDMTPYMLFLDNSMENTSARAVDEMYSFMERNNMGITSDGYILGYKKVKSDFTDIYSGKFDNSPGQIVEMVRNKVDDDASRTCSKGLHFCSMSYLPHYGSGPGDKIVIVKVHPKDIVSVPIDYNHAKVRCCRYEVLSEYTGDDKDDLLGKKAVWSDSDFRDEDDWNEIEDICDGCGEYEEYCTCDSDDFCDDADVSLSVDDNDDFDDDPVNTEYVNDREESLDKFKEDLTEAFAEEDVKKPFKDVLTGIEVRANTIFEAKIEEDRILQEKKIEQDHARILAEAQEQAVQEFRKELTNIAMGALQVWREDAKKAPNLPTSNDVQLMLSNLAVKLRQAEIAAGALSQEQSNHFDWEKWLADQVNEPDDVLVSDETAAKVLASLKGLK
jgi:hypothetical protein